VDKRQDAAVEREREKEREREIGGSDIAHSMTSFSHHIPFGCDNGWVAGL